MESPLGVERVAYAGTETLPAPDPVVRQQFHRLTVLLPPKGFFPFVRLAHLSAGPGTDSHPLRRVQVPSSIRRMQSAPLGDILLSSALRRPRPLQLSPNDRQRSIPATLLSFEPSHHFDDVAVRLRRRTCVQVLLVQGNKAHFVSCRWQPELLREGTVLRLVQSNRIFPKPTDLAR